VKLTLFDQTPNRTRAKRPTLTPPILNPKPDETINASDPVVFISRGPPAGANVTRNITSSDGKELLNCVEKCTGETDVNATR
jgi:hypothetical protein